MATKNTIRLNKFIANSGLCSRREADMHIGLGTVKVNGKIVTEMGYQVQPGDEVKFDGEGTEAITYKDFTYTNPNHQPERKGRNSQHFFADALRINAYPSLVFFDETGELIQALPGYKTAQELELFLKLVASDNYKNVLTEEAWARYQDEFKSTF